MPLSTKKNIKQIYSIKNNFEIADKIFQLELEGDFDLEDFKPGKFLHIKCADGFDPLLRRPMSICNIDDAGNTMTVLYRKEGKGTKVLSERKVGESLDVLAPLGNYFPTENLKSASKILLVGGGIGVPPLYYLGRKLKQQGMQISSILGFNQAKDVFYEKDFASLGEVKVSTIDGSHGHKGYVTDLLKEFADYDVLYSCGPTPMLKALQNLIPASESKLEFASLEERMGCGVGACLACVCDLQQENELKYVRVCTEGPVFDLHKVVMN